MDASFYLSIPMIEKKRFFFCFSNRFPFLSAKKSSLVDSKITNGWKMNSCSLAFDWSIWGKYWRSKAVELLADYCGNVEKKTDSMRKREKINEFKHWTCLTWATFPLVFISSVGFFWLKLLCKQTAFPQMVFFPVASDEWLKRNILHLA